MKAPRHNLAVLLVVCTAVTGGSRLTVAQSNPNGVPVCTASNGQGFVRTVADGFGGVIVLWGDSRSGSNVYAQRLSAAGVPMWTANGVLLGVTAGSEYYGHSIISDGAGGAIATWAQVNYAIPSNGKIFVRRINAAGVVGGGPTQLSLGDDHNPSIVADGGGGVIVSWTRRSTGSAGIYAQRLNSADGPQWTPGGIALNQIDFASYSTALAPLVTDGGGGTIVTWLGSSGQYVQRVNSGGTPQWTPGGVVVASGSSSTPPRIISDGAGGAIVTSGSQVQRVNSVGVTLWTPGGVSLSPANGSFAAITSDGAGGAIVTWEDPRNVTDSDIYAQRVDPAGVPQWSAGGVPLCAVPTYDQERPTITTDGAGGAIVAWGDFRNGSPYPDIYAQRVNAAGVPQWTADGTALCTAPGLQRFPDISSDGTSGAFVAWQDDRNSATTGLDIYAQRVSQNGRLLAVPPDPIQDLADVRAWPNPFARQVMIAFSLSTETPVQMEVLDVSGRRVRSSKAVLLSPGRHRLAWDGRTDDGSSHAGGVYFLRVHGPGIEASRVVVRMK